MYGAFTLFGRTFQTVPLTPSYPSLLQQTQPVSRLRLLRFVALQPRALLANHSVWALPRSLATTSGITVVFSSSGY